MGSVSIREAGIGDVEFLWTALYYASHSYEDAGVVMADIRSDPELRRYVEGWGRTDDIGVIASIDGIDVGAAWVRSLPLESRQQPTFVDSRTPELAVAVLPGHQGAGIGTRLLEELIRLARPRFRGIVLSVRVGNEALRLYRRLDFCEVERIRNRVGTESLKMVLDLEHRSTRRTTP